MKNNHIKLICLTGIFSALVFVVTAYLHIPTYNGYVHCGDGFIFIAASILPMPYAIAVGVLGAMLADLVTGYAIWAPGSMIIKGLLALLFTCKANKIITKRNLIMLLPAALISAAGYYLYEVLITGSFLASLSGIPGSLIQALTSSIIYVALGTAMDKYNLKKKMLEDFKR
ncbi:MAG: TIGR04002 family protein [Clostridia bacterium]|nr:TIGR04002 family protein [Clostridia bacterium]